MEVHETELPGVLLIQPRVFEDDRGHFKETYQKPRYFEAGIDAEFVQDNFSRSSGGTLRGMHYQLTHPQGKLVQALRGTIFDVAVDLRRNSPTFGRWTAVTLSESNHRQMYIPPGFAHGFCVLDGPADVFYKCSELYHPGDERTLYWNDPDVGIEWPLGERPVLSDKDRQGRWLADCDWYDGLQ